ncbi:hypothetical protein T265_05553 [Opisthorchis viverrini]|uniref:Uncharacterized protein n=1 Tax=Opisthorchis viverrini TaxID=6198 RepID=A0A074ZJZ8_OPIVI|nr:hypothetical protein T265_05553 [Opisthorchis viverrini]KER27376.1 hypothetical protein T265_05553 [Opisthorchis viverrini]
MTYTTNSILTPHRPSRGAISRVALHAAYSRAALICHPTQRSPTDAIMNSQTTVEEEPRSGEETVEEHHI